ncbi:hypothetical protein [Bacillus atrophaeus]|uniref:hypothetical protein n=1 Tax=Bacillus atrophaeus TaxID=1452 RepID=UPI002E209FC4|nr:hypothetical protein [Bacillus atrophaeus]
MPLRRLLMIIKELYARTPKRVERCLGHLKGYYYDHIIELTDQYNLDSYYGLEEKNEKIEIKYYADCCFDGRRTWTLASVWYENKPVMVIQNAGREGDDHRERFITEPKLYDKMLTYIASLLNIDTSVKHDIYREDDDIKELDNFYGFTLDQISSSYFTY